MKLSRLALWLRFFPRISWPQTERLRLLLVAGAYGQDVATHVRANLWHILEWNRKQVGEYLDAWDRREKLLQNR